MPERCVLSNVHILELWERGVRLHPLDRNVLTLTAARAGSEGDSPADWALGRRNRALLELLSSGLGRDVHGWLACPTCSEKLEFRMDGKTLVVPEEASRGDAVTIKGRLFRLPTSRDLARAARERDPGRAAIRLLEACQVDVGSDLSWSDLDIEEAGERMAAADPMAEIRLLFDCPDCGHEWSETLDPGAFVWAEIEARSKRLLREVHVLSSAYGWTEKEVLSLSEPRRAFYLEAIAS